ncbi:MAG: hypothetical protein GX599_08270 [Chloroflexi bacterium]|nr:hypothetical protein [Chloroflexota bacterium]
MKKIRAVILCAAAMSSGLIVEELKRISPSQGIDMEIQCFASLRYRSFDYSTVDLVLLAPQVKGQAQDIRGYVNERGFKHIPIMLIPMREYGMVKGESILNMMIKTIEKNQNPKVEES